MKKNVISKKATAAALCIAAVMGTQSGVFAAEQWIKVNIGGVDFKVDTYNGLIEKDVKCSTLGGDTKPKSNVKTYNVRIPETVEGVKIVGTSQNAFCDGDEFEVLTLPSSITTLGDYSFAGCDNIVSIKIPDSVKEIPRDCFKDCDKLATIDFGKGVKVIGANAFLKCQNITGFQLPANITEIGTNAFAYCTSLQSVSVPTGVTSLGDGVFSECDNLRKAVIAGSVGTVSKNLFKGCNNLEDVTLAEGIAKIDFNAFADCPNLKSVTIPDSVKNIADNAFANCKNVTVYCSKGSNAEVYAIKKGYAYKTAQAENTVVSVVPDTISVTLNGSLLNLSTPPINRNGSILVPMRAIFEALGADVEWSGTERKIYAHKGVTDINCWIGNNKAELNGKQIKLNAAPELVNGSTYVPARFVAESFGANVSWNAETQTVTIVTNK